MGILDILFLLNTKCTYKSALSLYFIPPFVQFTTFSILILTIEEAFPAILKDISATTKVIFTTEEVFTATLKLYVRSDHSPIKSYLSHYKSDIGH